MVSPDDCVPVKHRNRKFLNMVEKCKLIEENNKNDCKIYEFKVTEDTLNMNKTIHGGCTSTILEFCMKNAVSQNSERNVITVDLCVSFLNAAKLEDILLIKTFKIKEGGNLAFINAEITRKSDNKPIAIGKQTIAFSNFLQSKI